MSQVKNFLEDEILSEFDKLQDLDFGSEEYSRAVNGICMMCDKHNSIEKLEKDVEDKELRRTTDEEYRDKEYELNKKNVWFTIGIAIAGMIVGYSFDNYWMNEGFKFEESGTYRSKTFNPFVKINPKRK